MYFNFKKRQVDAFLEARQKLEKELMEILHRIDKAHPEKDQEFIRLVPIMHLYPKALCQVEHYGNLSRTYAEEIEKYYSGREFPYEVEFLIIYTPDMSSGLLYYMNEAGHKWSERAKADIHYRFPQAYHWFFEK